jgi:hypothetical protein
MQDIRELTREYYLKPILKSSLFSRKVKNKGYDVYVEVLLQYWDDPSYGNGGGSYSPEVKKFLKATTKDLINLGIEVR